MQYNNVLQCQKAVCASCKVSRYCLFGFERQIILVLEANLPYLTLICTYDLSDEDIHLYLFDTSYTFNKLIKLMFGTIMYVIHATLQDVVKE